MCIQHTPLLFQGTWHYTVPFYILYRYRSSAGGLKSVKFSEENIESFNFRDPDLRPRSTPHIYQQSFWDTGVGVCINTMKTTFLFHAVENLGKSRRYYIYKNFIPTDYWVRWNILSWKKYIFKHLKCIFKLKKSWKYQRLC